MPANVSAGGRASLRNALSTRQLTMIGLGGVIGAGLFVGSGKVIASTGPGIVFVYAATGVVIVLVMQMLAELAVANPNTGSFSAYASKELGSWAGLSVGWLYAYHWCVVIAFEAISGAAIANHLVPGIPTWLWALVFMSALTAVNLVGVASFGRFEYWFALIKVVAIIAFIAIGVVAILGLLPHVSSPGLHNLTGNGGLLPKGAYPMLTAALTVFFSYFGTELVTVAAGEAKDPVTAVRRSMRSVSWRILVFYIGSILIVVTLLPWNAAQVTQSPYAAVLGFLGLPGAETVMNLIVLTAVLSCLNSGLYSSSRMLFSMAQRGEAPRLFGTTRGTSQVPMRAVLAAAAGGFFTVVANYFLPTDVVFSFLLNSSGGIAVVVYLCITATQIVSRRRREREGTVNQTVRMWLFPYLSVLVLVALVVVIGGMAFTASSRVSLLLTLTVTVVAIAAGLVKQRRAGAREMPVQPSLELEAE
ncbi:amino acid permease [Amycolatopsis taiwanensis]|uniref:GABA permease n=1 Tax=Amycolatopsis taiwanensis TaxID=342230 RepID=A0A9W6VC80_9PSEU|nr:amino acid permease [Amycolatopsis taiwanensis]GLY65843.1 GABA permease [Amycolatopsis taiwanensis]